MSNKLIRSTLVITAFIAGVMVAPVAVSAAQKVFDPSFEMGNSQQGWNNSPYRYDDPDFKVKCWVSADTRGGISCLPWSEVKER